jgi:hypothetical protein
MQRLLPTLVIISNQRDLQLRNAAQLRREGAPPRVARPSTAILFEHVLSPP